MHECDTNFRFAQHRIIAEREPGGGSISSCTVGRSFCASARGASGERVVPALRCCLRTWADLEIVAQERAIALTSSSAPLAAQVPNAPAALQNAPPQVAAGAVFGQPQATHRPAAFAAAVSFNLNDDWDAEQIDSIMAAAGALGTSAGAAHVRPAHGAMGALEAAHLGAAGDDTQAVQTLALSRTEATAVHSI